MTTAMPGTIVDESVRTVRWRKTGEQAWQGCTQKRYIAETQDGLLKAMVGNEPAGVRGALLWHISVSHERRLPTWDELKHAKYTLVPADVPMVLIFPRRTAPYVNLSETCLHLWEAEGDIDT